MPIFSRDIVTVNKGRNMIYPLASSTWDDKEIAAIQRVVDSGMFTMGDNVRRFEEAFAAKHGKKYGVMVNSGSSANLVGVAALTLKQERPLQRGDEVLVPAVSWSTTYYPWHQYGIKLRFVDVELDTLNIDTSLLEAALTPQTRAVCAVSILGNPAALGELRAFCDKHGLYLFEDNCESLGATLGGKLAGSFGDLGTFSFFFSHHIATMEGGMVLTDDFELYCLLRAVRNHGWTRDQPPGSPLFDARDDDFFEAYRFVVPGYNVRPVELSGAIGLAQIEKLDDIVDGRRRNAAHFQSLFAGDKRFITQKENGRSSWFALTLILNPDLALDRKRILGALKEADIGYRIITGGCFLRQDVIRHLEHSAAGPIVKANIAHDHGFFVGNHAFDVRPQIDLLHSVLDKAAQ